MNSQEPSIVLTGDRPTGPLHLGHFVGSLRSRLELQEKYKQYVMIADVQALTDNFANPDKVINNIYQVAIDYLSVGIDPDKTTIFVQSKIAQLAELTVYLMNMVNLGRLERNPTVKQEIKQRGFEKEVPVGFLCYPISQTSDITAFKADIVPVGQDQLAILEQSNEIIRRFNRTYNKEVLKEVKPFLSQVPKLVGIDGKGKASKSENNAIFLSDSPQLVKQKVYSMYTDPDHIKISDPGKVEGNVVFVYLDAFHPNKEEVKSLKAHYRKGGLGDSSLKSLLTQTLEKFLEPIRQKRAEITMNDVKDVLIQGTSKAQKAAEDTLNEVKDAMGINYW